MRTLLLGILAAMSLTACDPYLFQNSVAPPGRSARLDEVTGFWGQVKHYRLEVSEGVALAFTCRDGGPCEKMKVISDNPQIAEVRLASLAQLQTNGYSPNAEQQPVAAFVVVGKGAGSTKIHVRAKEGSRDIVVTVVGTPGSTTAAAAAPVTAATE